MKGFKYVLIVLGALFVLAVVSLLELRHIREDCLLTEIRESTWECNAYADRLAVIEPDGEFKRDPGPMPASVDAWGTPLTVSYFKTLRNSLVTMGIDHLKVTSAGPDKKFQTEDDIVVTRSSRYGPGVMQ